jgi:hypothetical protein
MNYSFIAIVDISFRTLQPVFLSTPIELGGLGLDPPVIGTVMSFFGLLNGVFTVFFFSRLVDRLGVKRMYLMGITASVPCFSLFPVINYLARNSIERSGGIGTEVWLVVGSQVALSVIICLCYGASVSKRLKSSMHMPDENFRHCIYFHRRSCTEQSFSGSYERPRAAVGVYRACCRARTGEFVVVAVDR